MGPALRAGSRDPEDIGVLVADALDDAAITTIAKSTKVVIGAAGPFAKYGMPLARAAARNGTHYADITGETPWVRSVIEECDADARANGAIMIPMSGFDSIPADLGVLFTVEAIRAKYGCATKAITAHVRSRGGAASGGTIASGLNMISDPAAKAAAADPFCLVPRALGMAADAAIGAEAGAAAAVPGSAVVAAVADRWWYDWQDSVKAYAAPWPMEAINTRCVRRSAALAAVHGTPYSSAEAGPFAYSEWLSTRSWNSALSASMGNLALTTVIRLPFAAALLGMVVPKPGTGPSAEAMRKASVEYTFVAEPAGAVATAASATGSASASTAVSVPGAVKTRLSISMDGYMATAVLVGETALALAESPETLPGATMGGGVLTPAIAIGSDLVKRLEATGSFDFAVLDDEEAA
jgi:short subunit dehydrogenase-like uncharacterized protein